MNVGSWSKFVMDQDLIAEAKLSFNVWHRNECRDIKILPRSVIKHYKSMSSGDAAVLESFYRYLSSFHHPCRRI